MSKKIAVICNTMNEYHKAKMGLGVTLRNAGMDFDLFVWDNGSDNDRIKDLLKDFNPKFLHYSEENVGNPVSYNQMLLRVKEQGYDYVAMIAPDMVMPNRWLELYLNIYEKAELKGLLGYNWGMMQQKQMEVVNDVPLEYCDYVFGCWFFSADFLDTVGYINEEYKMYGKWDSDLNFRSQALGIKNYYIPVRCIHLNASWQNNSEYRKHKDKWLRHNEEVHKRELLRYAKEGNYYIAPPQKLDL